jgi:ELWxxDGT repeat protein
VDTLYFNAVDYNASFYDPELWKTNGAAQNTKIINPIYGSYPHNLVDVDGTLFFLADDGY